MNQRRTTALLICAAILLTVALSACSSEEAAPAAASTAPSISLVVTRTNCPSLEVQRGTQVLWTNGDTVNLAIAIEELEDHGKGKGKGGSEIQPGDIFGATFTELGRYKIQCSDESAVSGILTVVP